jgi:4-carboxymuconolactone decarboxylase
LIFPGDTVPRLALPVLEDMKPDQRAVYAQTVAGRRGSVPANVMVWLRSPDLAARAQKLGELIRYDTSLEPRVSELAILVVARRWRAQYEWAVHAAEARKAGLPDEVAEAIRSGTTPVFQERSDRIVYEFTSAVLADGQVSDDLYRTTIAELGERAVVELVALIGYYTMVAFTLNVFDIPGPAGSRPLDG